MTVSNISQTRQWSVLDNAAKLFPATIHKYSSSFFRLEVLLNESFIAEPLQLAIQLTLLRYPLLQVRLRRGAFWYFFEPYNHPVRISPLNQYGICEYVPLAELKQNAPCWRILLHENRLALEVSHIVTDGIGAMEFLKTLLCVYYEKVYGKIKDWQQIKTLNDDYNEKEFEYSYKKHFHKKGNYKVKLSSSFHYPDERGTKFCLTRLHLSLSQVQAVASSFKVTITELIIAVHLYVVQKIYKSKLLKNQGLVRELVLVNLRNLFGSETLRNFYLFVRPQINFALGKYSFEDVIRKVHYQLQDALDPYELQHHFSEYVRAELGLFRRIIPRPLKNLVLSVMKRVSGEQKILSSISNLGKIQLPQELESVIHSFAVAPLSSLVSGKDITIIGYKDCLTVTIGRYIKNINLEQELAKYFLKLGIDTTFLEW